MPSSSPSTSFPPPFAQHIATTLYSLLSIEVCRSIIGSKKPLIATLVGLLSIVGTPTRSIKDALKALYPLNCTTLVELGAMLPLFTLVVKDRQRGVVEDVTAVIAQVARCDESVEAFPRVDNVIILVDLVVGGSGRVRENVAATLLNLVKSGGDKVVGDIREVVDPDVTRAWRHFGEQTTLASWWWWIGGGNHEGFADDDSGVSTKGKSKAKALLRVLESEWGSQLRDLDDSKTGTVYTVAVRPSQQQFSSSQ
ncbi:hypothetical protein MUK42_13926 [Musa troglodytarum]|uniref:ARM repeat superfamily protein n=1 Tax=Musa troglodytarum TaxID=320322 RepID=A0A9E7I1B2_9LILI|nr:hypothetical protein MUK42_13926 [Musa troglodytarum]